MSETLRRPWANVDPTLTASLRSRLPAAIDATIGAIRAQVPSYAEFGAGPVAAAVRRGVEIALQRWLELLGTTDDALDPSAVRVYAGIGAGEWRSGRTMEALLAAYRTGARVVWEHMSAAAVAAGAAPDDLVALAEAIFVYIDELSAASASGYADARTADADLVQAARAQLARLLLTGDPVFDSGRWAPGGTGRTGSSGRSGQPEGPGQHGVDPARLRALAAQAGWKVPARVVAARVLVDGDARWPPVGLGSAVLVIDGGESRSAVFDADLARRERLAAPGVRVAVGVPVPPTQASESLRTAELLQARLDVEGWPGGNSDDARTAEANQHAGVVLAGDHLLALTAGAEPLLSEALSDEALGALHDLPAGKRTVLRQTLWVWLATGGDRVASAAHLHVHPQTVSYRVNRLRELLGGRLEDPQRRAAMLVALSADRW